MNVEKKPPALGNLNEFLHPGGECQNLNQLVVCGVCVLCAVVVIRVRHKVVCLYTYKMHSFFIYFVSFIFVLLIFVFLTFVFFGLVLGLACNNVSADLEIGDEFKF